MRPDIEELKRYFKVECCGKLLKFDSASHHMTYSNYSGKCEDCGRLFEVTVRDAP